MPLGLFFDISKQFSEKTFDVNIIPQELDEIVAGTLLHTLNEEVLF